jgi:hypothetical protein
LLACRLQALRGEFETAPLPPREKPFIRRAIFWLWLVGGLRIYQADLVKLKQLQSLSLLLCLPLAAFSSGCRVVKGAAKVPGGAARTVTPDKKENQNFDPVQIQQGLVRFSDVFLARTTLGIDKLRRGTNTLAPAEVLRWKTTIGTKICAIASGPNSAANLLDMTAFVSVTRRAIEDYWQPKIFGESAQPILESCRDSETNIWRLAASVLTPNQQAELRAAIEAWCRENPPGENALASHSTGFTSRLAEAGKADTSARSSVFSLLMLDPLSGLDPATREIAQTRLFAERALFVAQWMPTLVRWQTELLSLNAVAMPEVQQLVTNSTQIAASVERFAGLAEKLPGQLSSERETIVKALQTQEQQLTPLVDQVRQTLAAGTQMSTSLNTTITTFDGLMKRFGIGETNHTGPPDTNSQPFQILDYAQTATHMESMARQLTELLQAVDHTLGSTNLARLSVQAGPVVQQAQSSGKALVDYAFWRAILLAVILLTLALLYRFLSGRLFPRRLKPTAP